MNPHAKEAYKAIVEKCDPLGVFFDYYEGKQRLTYTLVERLRKIFARWDFRIVANWCAVVVDACADRIRLDGFAVADDEAAQTKLDQAWRLMALAVESDDVHEASLVAGEAFLVVWLDPVTGEPTACYNDPRLCYVAYDPENGRRKLYAAKLWAVDPKTSRLNLYYADRIEYYEVRGASGITEIDLQPNPFGVIPVFHFKNKGSCSDLESVIPLQDGINKLLIDMMVAAEFGAFPQRYVISGSDTKGLKNEPGAVWDLAAGDGIGQGTAAGQFEPTQLKNYHEASAQLVSTIGAITRTPKHLFYQGGGDPSGDALIAMEAPLIKKAQDRIDRFVPEWRAAARFILQLLGLDVPLSDIEPVFATCETVQPLAKAQIRKLSVEAGIPLDTAVREEGWSQSEIDQMHQDAADMAGAQQASLASVLVSAQRGFDQGPNVPTDYQGPNVTGAP